MAKRPPSSWTMGRSSGGMTGMDCRIIHSGRLSERRKPSTTFRRLTARESFCPLEVLMVSRSDGASVSRSTAASSSRMASAPMPPRKYTP